MPPWWGKSSSKDVKKKTNKENLIDTLQRFLGSTDQKGVKSRVAQRDNNDITSEKGSRSRAESRSTSPSKHVSRCQSFSARPHTHPLPLPGRHPGITRTASEVSTSKPILEKRGKPPLLLPLPQPNLTLKRPNNTQIDRHLAAAYVSSSSSTDTDDPVDSQLQSPVGNSVDHCNISASRNLVSVPSPIKRKNPSEIPPPPTAYVGNRILSSSPKQDIHGSHQVNGPNLWHGALANAPDSLLSSPSKSPRRVIYPEQIPTSAFLAPKPHPDLTFLSSGQCSSAGSGQTSGHNSMGGEILGQFWLHSRGSPEYSPIPSPRLTSAGPSSRINSGAVSPLHPRAGGTAPESPKSLFEEGRKQSHSPRMTSAGPSSRVNSGAVSPLHPRAGGTAPESPKSMFEEGRKQSHRLPLPPISITTTPFHANNTTTNTSPIPRSPGKTETPTSPGSRWKKGKLIGRGTFGHVYVGFNSESGEMCAMKEVTLFIDDAKSKESARQLGQEISLLSRLRHPNIVQYYGSEMIDDKLYIYLEYVSGGSIHKLLQDYGQFGEPAIRSYTYQILSGLSYLHAKNTVHRDIKGANILVDPNGRVKLADFGMAKHINGQSCPLSFRGSPYWMAPEVIKNSNGCNLAVDIWSLGCTVLEMATSRPPWSQFEGIAAMFKIGNSKELPPIPDHLSDDGKDFVRRCLQRDPSNRPAAAELLQHPFVKGAAPLEKPLLCSEPAELLTSVSARTNTKGIGHARNLSSLDMEGLAISHPGGGKANIISSDVHMRYISCPVSPIGSPLLNSRSPQHFSGMISPSPISSPRAMSGASTPLSGGNGAVSFSRPKQATYLNDVLTSSP